MWKDMFVKRKYATLKLTDVNKIENQEYDNSVNKNANTLIQEKMNNKDIIEDIFMKCPKCGEILIKMELDETQFVCQKCTHHFRIDSIKRAKLTFDDDTIEFFDKEMKSINPLEYPKYTEKTKQLRNELKINDAVITGAAKINGVETCFGIMDSRFIMGSMGSVVGEKLSRMYENAIERKLPVVVFTVSGGARMQEGVLSLMQMAKVSAAVKKHSNAGLLYVTVLTDPTTGGVTASFASLGDIIISEPGATIGFAGKRVIEQTIRQKLPDTFQSAEFLLEHGFVDMIVHRKDMKNMLSHILGIHGGVAHE
jgi:acetyl-CoA carboxylase carboxyl transferase beta subunit